MNSTNRLTIIYGLSCVAIVILYYDLAKKVEKSIEDTRAELRSKMKEYEDAVALKASEQ